MPIAEYVDLALREGLNVRGRMCCLDYFKKISEISKIFHHKNVITFLYFKGNHSPLRDILRFFQIRGHLLLRTEPHTGATEGVSNHSLPVEYVEAMRLFFGKIIDEKERTKLCEKARKSDTFNKCDFIDRKDYTILDSISRKKILSAY